MQGKCSTCGFTGDVSLVNVNLPVPVSDTYCRTCYDNCGERLQWLFYMLDQNYELYSRYPHVTGYKDGVYHPMDVVCQMYWTTKDAK
jgi:hypothetical protein